MLQESTAPILHEASLHPAIWKEVTHGLKPSVTMQERRGSAHVGASIWQFQISIASSKCKVWHMFVEVQRLYISPNSHRCCFFVASIDEVDGGNYNKTCALKQHTRPKRKRKSLPRSNPVAKMLGGSMHQRQPTPSCKISGNTEITFLCGPRFVAHAEINPSVTIFGQKWGPQVWKLVPACTWFCWSQLQHTAISKHPHNSFWRVLESLRH